MRLVNVAGDLINAGLAETTRIKYATGVKAFRDFTRTINWTIVMPVPERVMTLFAASMVGRVSASTIQGYVAAVASWHIDEGKALNQAGMMTLKRAIDGMERLQPRKAVKRAVPITAAILEDLARMSDLACHDDVVFMAVAALATIGVLRLGELVPTSKVAGLPLMAKHISVKPDAVELSMPRSKMDQLGLAPPHPIAKTNALACPWRWVKEMRQLMVHSSGDGPAFIKVTGVTVTRGWIIAKLNDKMEAMGWRGASFSGHSFRRGGATSLAAAGVSPHLVARCGRWKSSTYQIYIDPTREAMLEAQRALASSSCRFGVLARSRPVDTTSGQGAFVGASRE
jgi:hypothetical protein